MPQVSNILSPLKTNDWFTSKAPRWKGTSFEPNRHDLGCKMFIFQGISVFSPLFFLNKRQTMPPKDRLWWGRCSLIDFEFVPWDSSPWFQPPFGIMFTVYVWHFFASNSLKSKQRFPNQRWDDHPQIQGVDGPPSGRSSPSAHARDHPDLRLAGDFYNVHLGDRGFFGATKNTHKKKNECYKLGPKSPVILVSY